jgi:hypothetical protein
MGIKLFVESSASDSEMLVMDFDGDGCVLAWEGVDGVGDKQFVEVARGAHNKGQPLRENPGRRAANHGARLAAFRTK